MRKILIIDGDYEFTKMVILFLENSHFEVAGANNVEEARSEIERLSPDLILLSRDLIGESGNLIPEGLGLLKEIKTHPRWKKIPVIFLVEGAEEKDLEKLRRLKYKAEDYARKPLEDNELLRRIENLIGFDPEETASTWHREMERISQPNSSHPKAELQRQAEKEIKELFQRLGEELEKPEPAIDFMPGVEDLSPEQIKNELEFIQSQMRRREQEHQRLREKWRQAIGILEERIKGLEREKQRLQEELNQTRSELGRLNQEHQDLIALFEQGGNLILELEKLKEKFQKLSRARKR